MTSPDATATPTEVYQPWESVASSWDSLNGILNQVHDLHADSARTLVWRGVTDAEWGLRSTLYRRLFDKLPGKNITEELMCREEAEILATARSRWRLDHLPALEILAHIQHYGGPTRMLDVTQSPLAAAWFATEQRYDRNAGTRLPDKDGRIFCFFVGEQIELDDRWGGRKLPWLDWGAAEREENVWGHGDKRRYWRPPAYNARISAQNAGFILDGIPVHYAGGNKFPKGPSIGGRWKAGEIRAVSSIPIRLNQISRARQTQKSKPMFTIRIEKDAMAPIREHLEWTYGFDRSSMYPDLFGLAERVAPTLPNPC